MISRRVFGRLFASTLLAAHSPLQGQVTASGKSDSQFSVMIWTLRTLGSFEENLERVAQAGYGNVELIGESLKWSDAETSRMLARMDALGIKVDATSGLAPGFADPAASATYSAKLEEFAKAVQRVRCKRLILFSGKRIQGMTDEDHQRVSIETLKRAAEVLEKMEMDAVLEPIDRLENPTDLDGHRRAGLRDYAGGRQPADQGALRSLSRAAHAREPDREARKEHRLRSAWSTSPMFPAATSPVPARWTTPTSIAS